MTLLLSEGGRNPPKRLTLKELAVLQWQVLSAIILRDIRTRWVGNHFGMVISVGWPLSHIVILLVINTLLGRLAPYGDSPALWFATGVIPFLAYSYMARFIIFGVIFNKQMLMFPRVKIMDLIFARVIVEILSNGSVVLILMLLFWVFDIDFAPIEPIQALFAMGAMMLLGLGVGVINAIIAAALPMWSTFFALTTIIFWIISGVYYVPTALPQQLQYYLSFNPITHGIEWMRVAYFEGYPTHILDKGYLLGWGICTFALGMVIERLVRGRLLKM